MTIYLYVKQHNITGLKYFGKTQRDPYKYRGSGKYWLRHLKKYGNDVSTIAVYEFTDIKQCSTFAEHFSLSNKIVESKQWANLRLENGLDGGDTSQFIDYSKVHIHTRGRTYEEIYGKERAAQLKHERSKSNSQTKRGRSMSEEQKAKRRHSYGPRSDDFKAKMSQIAKNRPKPTGTCPHCGKTGVLRSMKRWHFDRCREKTPRLYK